MQNITLEKYFNISEILGRKTKEDFEKYRDKLHSEKHEYNKNDKIKELLKYTAQYKENQTSEVFEYLANIKYILLITTVFTFIVTYLFFDRDININEYLIFSVLLPFAYFIWLAYSYSQYRRGVKVEQSIVSNILKRKFNTEDFDKHSQPLKTYSLLVLCKIGIAYSLGVFLSTFIMFNVHSITFYTASTYQAEETTDNIEVPNNVKGADTNKTIKIIKSNSGREIMPQQSGSILITILIIVVIVLKLIIWFFANRNLNQSINDSLLLQGNVFFNVMEQNVVVKQKTSQENTSPKKVVNTNNNTLDNNFSLLDYYVLYYQIDLNVRDKIDFDFSNDIELNNKTSESFSFAIFDKEDEDENVISKLGNLVLIFTSPESSTDNTFKDDIKLILKQEKIKQIWILPLVESNNSYCLAQKGDDKYDEWQKQINKNVKNDKVRLYNEK